MLSAEQSARLQALRARAIAGEATMEELKEGNAILRQDRIGAQAASTTARAAKADARKVVDPAAVLADLKALGAKLASGPVA